MAALFESGVTYGERAWHGLDNNLSADDARRWSVDGTITAAGMDWSVVKAPLAIAQTEGDLAGTPAAGVYGVFRTDRWECLGAAGESYRPLQNRDIFAQFQPFLDAKAMSFESAGALDNGKRVYVQARLAREDYDVGGGDVVSPYLLIASSHDGSLATSVLWTPQRVVCQNTLSAAIGNQRGLLRVKHTSGQRDALDAIMETVDLANQQFVATCEQYARLAATPINRDDLELYVRQVLGFVDVRDLSSRAKNQFDAVMSAALYGRGNRGSLTVWTAYNGVTEWTTHKRQRSAEARRKSVWFGASAATNRTALELALQLAS